MNVSTHNSYNNVDPRLNGTTHPPGTTAGRRTGLPMRILVACGRWVANPAAAPERGNGRCNLFGREGLSDTGARGDEKLAHDLAAGLWWVRGRSLAPDGPTM